MWGKMTEKMEVAVNDAIDPKKEAAVQASEDVAALRDEMPKDGSISMADVLDTAADALWFWAAEAAGGAVIAYPRFIALYDRFVKTVTKWAGTATITANEIMTYSTLTWIPVTQFVSRFTSKSNAALRVINKLYKDSGLTMNMTSSIVEAWSVRTISSNMIWHLEKVRSYTGANKVQIDAWLKFFRKLDPRA